MTNDAIKQIIDTLNSAFVELDAKMLSNQQAWVAGRAVKLAEFKASVDRRAMGEFAYYKQAFAICGGKTWFGIIGGSEKARIEFVIKNCKAIADKRNANIARKLIAAEVTEILSADVGYTSDGFNGTFKVESRNNGTVTINIQTIYAGGHSVQCFHQRTLVKVR